MFYCSVKLWFLNFCSKFSIFPIKLLIFCSTAPPRLLRRLPTTLCINSRRIRYRFIDFFFACRFFFVNFSKRFQGIDAFAQFGQQSQQYHPSPELSEQINASKCSPYLTEVKMRSFRLKIAENQFSAQNWKIFWKLLFFRQKTRKNWFTIEYFRCL